MQDVITSYSIHYTKLYEQSYHVRQWILTFWVICPMTKKILREMVEECCSIYVNDGILFETAVITLQDIVEGADYHGVRIRFNARLGPARIPMQIDIGFGDAVVPAPRITSYNVCYTKLLRFR